MSATDALADALALAFLAGPWSRRELLLRARMVMGEQPRWLNPLVRHVLARFPEAPNDALRSLSVEIQRAKSFRRGNALGQPRSRIAKLLVGEPSMGPRRWPVPSLRTSAEVAE